MAEDNKLHSGVKSYEVRLRKRVIYRVLRRIMN